LLSSVMISSSDTGVLRGCINGWSTSLDNNSRRLFRTNEDGTTLTWADDDKVRRRQREGDFGKLSYYALGLIMKYAIASPTGVMFDLDKQIAYSLNVSAFAINSRSRNEAQEQLRLNKETVLQMSTQKSRTNFFGMYALRRWQSNPVMLDFFPDLGYLDNATLRLKFELDDNAVSLQDLEVDVLSLIQITYNMHSNVKIQFMVESKAHAEIITTSFSIKLGLLRLNCYLLLSWVIRNHPDRTHGPCPQIWTNGKGQALKAVYPSTRFVPSKSLFNTYVTWSQRLPPSRKVTMGSGYAEVIKHEHRLGYLDQIADKSTLISWWLCLKKKDQEWKDY
jgi:hypothetical protein